MLHHQVSLLQGDATDHVAQLTVRVRNRAEFASLVCRLRGPHCRFTRTLAADFGPAHGEQSAANEATTLLVTDPCYWTPALPYLYDLELTLTSTNGKSHTHRTAIGLRRWHSRGRNLMQERRRTVLRGARTDQSSEETLQSARAAETALLVACPADEFCHEASGLGVALLADLRATTTALPAEVARLGWHPAVMMVLLTGEQLAEIADRELTPLGQFASSPAAVDARSCALVTELVSGAQPAVWIASAEKPVIAIRTGAAYADLPTARLACDRLQAELAPDFDLAGYFVSP